MKLLNLNNCLTFHNYKVIYKTPKYTIILRAKSMIIFYKVLDEIYIKTCL